MNEVQQAAFELRLEDLQRKISGERVDRDVDLDGAMLAACSAHDPEPESQVKAIRLLLKSGARVDERDKNGVTPLHRAVRFRSPAAVAELLRLGADPNATDRRTESTPLHRAVTQTGAPATAGKLDEAVAIVELLLSNGADPRTKNKKGRSPDDYAKNPRLRAALAAG